MDKVLLIDAHNAMWRASIAFSPKKAKAPVAETSDDGWEMVPGPSAPPQPEKKEIDDSFVFIYNFFRNLRPIIEQFSPDKCFFVLEGHPQFRYDLFADYKANRIIKNASEPKKQEKFLQSKDEIVKILQHFPITLVRASNYEADDVVATLCDNMRDEELTVLSNDSDYIQLLQRGYPHCQIYDPIKKIFMAAPVYPYVAWKSLAGDVSDNIPALLKPKSKSGVKAAEMLEQPELFKKFMEVEENRANFSVNRQLIEFRSVPMEEIVLHEGVRNFDIVKQEFERMDFQSIINEKSWVKYTKTFDCLRY
jgi:5'-3' exonuclease